MENISHCEHYNRNCKIVAKCCNKIFDCRLCHDSYYENYDYSKNKNKDKDKDKDKIKYHKINRYETEKVVCKVCNLKQNISNQCIQCNTIFGKYFCKICKFYDNDISKKQFHCEKCNICRVGGRENFYHCDNCNSCISINLKDNHKCLKNTFHNKCPICLEDIFNSVKNVVMMKCGHSIHHECFQNLIKSNNIKCPYCNKSVIDLKMYNSVIEEEINNTPMPEIYNYNVDILCNDCNKVSNTKFHIIGHKCNYCESYNTVKI